MSTIIQHICTVADQIARLATTSRLRRGEADRPFDPRIGVQHLSGFAWLILLL